MEFKFENFDFLRNHQCSMFDVHFLVNLKPDTRKLEYNRDQI